MFFLVDHLTLKEIRWRPCLMQHFIFFEYYIIITFLAKQHKCSCPSTWHWVKEQMPGVAGSTTTARYHFVVVYIHSQVLQTCMSYIMLQPCQAFFFLAVCDLLGKFAFSSLPLLYRMYSANTILKNINSVHSRFWTLFWEIVKLAFTIPSATDAYIPLVMSWIPIREGNF